MSVPEDVQAHRHWLRSFVECREPAVYVDLGCGNGVDLLDFARRAPHPGNRFIGIDESEKVIANAIETTIDPRIEFQVGDLSARFPFDDGAFDVVYSNNLLECIEAPVLFAQEVGRILKPGGVVVVGHWDWDSQIYESADKALVRRLVHAFADWKQPWMNHVDGWMGRRLWGLFKQSELFDGNPHARVLTNTVFSTPFYGRARADDFFHLVINDLASGDEVARFLTEQAELAATGRYFYSITGFAFVGRRRR